MKMTRSVFIAIMALVLIASCSKGLQQPSLQSPGNRSANVPGSQTFTASPLSDAVTYQFYFDDQTTPYGFNSGPLVTNTYRPFPPLTSGHLYLWHVEVSTNRGLLKSDTWSFTVQ